MPEVVQHLAGGAQFVEVVGGEATQGEPVEVAATGEQHDQQDGEQERRDGIADDDRRAGPDVEVAAVPHRLGDAQRDRHQVHDQRAPQAERDGHRHLLDDQLGDRSVAEEALPEVEVQVVLDHDPEALAGRLVEAVHALDLLDQFGIQTLGTTIGIAGRGDLGPAAGDAPGGAASGGIEAFELGDHLLHRTTGGGLDDDEVDQQDAEQGRDDQQQAPCDIGQHQGASCPASAACSAGLPVVGSAFSRACHQAIGA
ncbi:hypothetical protein D9M71_546800 [compost metagenome]